MRPITASLFCRLVLEHLFDARASTKRAFGTIPVSTMPESLRNNDVLASLIYSLLCVCLVAVGPGPCRGRAMYCPIWLGVGARRPRQHSLRDTRPTCTAATGAYLVMAIMHQLPVQRSRLDLCPGGGVARYARGGRLGLAAWSARRRTN